MTDEIEFKAGDTVRLKSGGPVMTVNTVFDNSGTPSADCYWFEKTEQMTKTFPVTVLVKTEPPARGPTFARIKRS